MNYVTHSLGGAVVGTVMGTVAELAGSGGMGCEIVVIGGAVLGSLLPDIDHRNSYIGHKLPVLSHISAAVFKHRGFLHTPVFAILFSTVLLICGKTFLNLEPWSSWAVQGIFWGMISHLCLDTLNVQGISWAWPVSRKKFHVLSIRTNSLIEHCITIGLFITAGGFAMYQWHW